LNPFLGNGRVFFLTDFGRAVVEAAFDIHVAPLPAQTNWEQFGKVARARVRRRVLEEIAKPAIRDVAGKSTSEIRKNLLDRSPMELSRAIRAVNDLAQIKLIRVPGFTPKQKRKLYMLTPAGRRVVEALKQSGPASDPKPPTKESAHA